MVSGVDGPGGDEAVLADIRAAQDGDAGAYARLVESWGGRLLRFCHNNLPATIDAEDAVQDVLLTAWQNCLASTTRPGSERGYTLSPAIGAEKLLETQAGALPTQCLRKRLR